MIDVSSLHAQLRPSTPMDAAVVADVLEAMMASFLINTRRRKGEAILKGAVEILEMKQALAEIIPIRSNPERAAALARANCALSLIGQQMPSYLARLPPK